jgi:homoserine kinase
VKALRVEVPASSANLGPGFDTLGLALELADTFTVERDDGSREVTVDGATCEAAGVPADEHYVCRAYRLWAQETGADLPGARFTLDRRIPIGRGLGSSAAAIVAGLAAAAFTAGDNDPRDRIVRLAGKMEGHPDNAAAAALGGLTTAFCDGDDIHALHVVNHVTVDVALFVPDEPLPTAEARAILPANVPIGDAVFNLSRAAYVTTALAWGRWEHIAAAMRDRLHQPYRRRLIPALDEVIDSALAKGAFGAALSGGGPSVIALTPRGHAEHIATAMEARAHELSWAGRSMVTGIRARGVQVTEIDELGASE